MVRGMAVGIVGSGAEPVLTLREDAGLVLQMNHAQATTRTEVRFTPRSAWLWDADTRMWTLALFVRPARLFGGLCFLTTVLERRVDGVEEVLPLSILTRVVQPPARHVPAPLQSNASPVMPRPQPPTRVPQDELLWATPTCTSASLRYEWCTVVAAPLGVPHVESVAVRRATLPPEVATLTLHLLECPAWAAEYRTWHLPLHLSLGGSSRPQLLLPPPGTMPRPPLLQRMLAAGTA